MLLIKLLVQAFFLNTPGLLRLTTLRDQRQPVPRLKPFKTPQLALSPTREGTASRSRPSCSSYIGFQFQSANLRVQFKLNRRAGVQSTARTPSCVSGKIANLCLSLEADNRQLRWSDIDQHIPSAANQHTSWQSLIRCWTLHMEQSANPAARVDHYTISTNTQNASIWSLTAALSECSSCAVYKFSYLHVDFSLRSVVSTVYPVYSVLCTRH